MPTSATPSSPARYELLARELEQQIGAGVLRPGDRLPSVRQTCVTRDLSPSTVFQAYYLLESRGLVRAVPRSGYFVAARADGVLLAAPGTTEPTALRRLLTAGHAEEAPALLATARLLLTGEADLRSTIAAIHRGGLHRTIGKPWNDDELVLTLRQLAQGQQLEAEKQGLERLTAAERRPDRPHRCLRAQAWPGADAARAATLAAHLTRSTSSVDTGAAAWPQDCRT